MNNLTQSALSTQEVQVQVAAIQAGGIYDPTGDVVQMAFMPVTTSVPGTNPGSGDWHTATWETNYGPTYWAGCLVGPVNGGVSLTVGTYQVWVKVTDNPEVPVEPAGLLTIY